MKNEASTTTESAAVAEQAAPVAPEQAPSTKTIKAKKNAPKGQKAAKGTKTAAKPASKKAAKKQAKPASKKAAKDAAVPREFSKKAIVIEMMRRKEGATLAEIAKATDWQPHSIRGFISGSLTKKMGLKVESTKNEAGDRTYRIAK
ncbi:MAG TPA: DUF3489 domain-containing protein [Bryobacteraceae bacterium]|nr:DUF3489 domain-containing protein [Bryobacteraceae bacterium]